MFVLLTNWLANTFLVAGVVLPYIPQARIILEQSDASGWNVLVSLMLIASSLLRCFFWYCKRFDDTLLVQAVISIATQLAMTWVVVFVGRRRGSARGSLVRKHTLLGSLCGGDGGPGTSFDAAALFRGFWRWTDMLSYVIVVAAFTCLLCVTTYLFKGSAIFTEGIGMLALGVEAFVPVPQALQNQIKRSTAGLSVILILCWAAGDMFKTVVFVARGAPLQFLLCGLFQLGVDALLFLQVFVLFPTAAHPASATSLIRLAGEATNFSGAVPVTGPAGRFHAGYSAVDRDRDGTSSSLLEGDISPLSD